MTIAPDGRRSAFSICAGMLSLAVMFACFVPVQVNASGIERTFETLPYNTGNPSGHKIREGTLNLTGVVAVDPVTIVSNNVHEYEGMAVGFKNPVAAWSNAFRARSYRKTRNVSPIENAGLVAVTQQGGEELWDAYFHSLQNERFFYPATNLYHTFSGGNTARISRVLIGSLGDWILQGPSWSYFFETEYPMALHLSPQVDWKEFAEIPQNVDDVITESLETYYKLEPDFLFEVNDVDCDRDDIPDFADGYNRDGISGNEDDECPCAKVTSWRIHLPQYLAQECLRIEVLYNSSDPWSVTRQDEVWSAAPGLLRMWTRDESGNRSIVTNGRYVAAQIGVSGTNRYFDLEIEAVNRTEWEDITGEAPIRIFVWSEGDASCSNFLYWANQDEIWEQTANFPFFFDRGAYAHAGTEIIRTRIVPDWNRDRIIDTNDFNKADDLNPLRFWINDDKDDGDISNGDSDVPGQSGWLTPANHQDNKVNGRSDLLDFFPLWFDLAVTLTNYPVDQGYEYRLRQEDEALRFVYTDLTRGDAGTFHIAESNIYGAAFNQPAHETTTVLVTRDGTALSDDFLARISANPDKGVLIFEGIKASKNPLVLEIKKADNLLAQIPFPISISGVEDMYRTVNIRTMRNPGILSEPDNYPDSLCNGINFIFLHGNNVPVDGARAWNSEVFKRLHQSGSRYVYHGVSWKADEGSNANYHEHVYSAFKTAPILADYIYTLSGENILSAQSLGNVVCGSAIQDYDVQHIRYFMINAAVPAEAYDAALADSPHEHMIHPSWKEYEPGTWSANWHQLFTNLNDNRSRLMWRGRFSLVVAKAYNIFSETDEVFDTHEDVGLLTDPGLLPGGEAPLYHYSWQIQEMFKGVKGRPFNGSPFGLGTTDMAGWAFNLTFYGTRQYAPDAAREILANNSSAFINEPVFRPSPSELFNGINADNINEILSKGIPALTAAAGKAKITKIEQDGLGNINLNTHTYRPNGTNHPDDKWFHNDMKNLSYFFTYNLYKKLLDQD